jgi:3-oxoadipate enol-lactonase
VAFARVNDVVLHHQVSGRPDGPVLVFANSLGTDFRIWNDVAAALGKTHRIVLYDKRGHGLSDATPAPYAITDHVRDLAALLDHLGIAQSVVVGLSVGGQIAQGIAALRPDLVRALVLCDTGHKIGTNESWNARIDQVRSAGMASIADAVMLRWFTKAYCSPDNPDFAGYRNMLSRTTVEGYTGTCAALRDSDLTESARALKLPVLCMVGDQDLATTPELVRELSNLITGSEYHLIRDAGHLPCIERPAEVTQLIGAFLRSIGYV